MVEERMNNLGVMNSFGNIDLDQEMDILNKIL